MRRERCLGWCARAQTDNGVRGVGDRSQFRIGFATSQALYEQGHTVVLGCRPLGLSRCLVISSYSINGSKVIPFGGLDLGSLPIVRQWVSKYVAKASPPSTI